MKLYVATHNAHKVAEIAEILSGIEIVPDDPGDVDENAPDFAGNALVKVRSIAPRHAGEWSMADDSGLEVASLGGAPGVRSARYAGEPSDTAKNNALLLANLDGKDDRRANFTCAIALVDPQGREHVVEGKCFGAIAENPSGLAGFGYDPLFIPDGCGRSFAELSAQEKNAISHRGRALAKARDVIASAAPAKRRANGAAPYLELLRIVNLPTVPGDVFAGAAAAVCGFSGGGFSLLRIAAATAAASFAYLFGLADNDIAGAATDDARRPIPRGDISLPAARFVRAILWCAAAACGAAGSLPAAWWIAAILLFAAIAAYNRTKCAFLMGLCRAFSLLSGAAAVAPRGAEIFPGAAAALVCAALWTAYIASVTAYSAGEGADAAKRANVGFLVGAIVYLQLAALVVFAMWAPCPATRVLLLGGGAMLVLLRIFRKTFPKVSAS